MKEDRLSEIATQAALLFDEHGYHQTTMDDIAGAVNLRKPTLYHYIGSKEEILSLIHEEFVELLFIKQDDRFGKDYTS